MRPSARRDSSVAAGSRGTDPGNDHAHILVVDDDKLSLEQLVGILKKFFARVDSAENGLAALGKALEHPPDLILSDVQMPGMDGWQLLRIVRSRPKLANVPVIFLTNLKGDAERLRAALAEYGLGDDGEDDELGDPSLAPDSQEAAEGADADERTMRFAAAA